MGPSVDLELVQTLDKSDAVLDVIIMDDVNTTIAKLKSEDSPEIVKWSDVNHTKKITEFFTFQIGSKIQNSNIKKKYSYHAY